VIEDASKMLGRRGEDEAVRHFERLGYDVLARNHRTRFGELDLIVADADAIVFVEVKTRRAGTASPWENLHEDKRRQVRKMAAAWLNEAAGRRFAGELRFDAVAVVVNRDGSLVSLEHLEGAF